VPTRQVLADFEPVTADNRLVVVQEGLAEAFTMWGIAAMVIAVTASDGADAGTRALVYRVAAVLLIALGTLTALTGARTRCRRRVLESDCLAAGDVRLWGPSAGSHRVWVWEVRDGLPVPRAGGVRLIRGLRLASGSLAWCSCL
jgi:hypothetical protein